MKRTKKLTKKRSFGTRACSLNNVATSKPIGVRMGGGKGKPLFRFALHRRNQRYILMRETSRVTAETLLRVLNGYTSYRLGLILHRATY